MCANLGNALGKLLKSKLALLIIYLNDFYN